MLMYNLTEYNDNYSKSTGSAIYKFVEMSQILL